MEKYFETLNEVGVINIPEQFTGKFGWNENTPLYQFIRGGELFITDRKPEHSEKTPHESVLDSTNKVTLCKELLDEAGIGFDESLAVYVFYDRILGLAKDYRECAVCGKPNELATVKDKYVCYDCTLQISALEDNAFK